MIARLQMYASLKLYMNKHLVHVLLMHSLYLHINTVISCLGLGSLQKTRQQILPRDLVSLDDPMHAISTLLP